MTALGAGVLLSAALLGAVDTVGSVSAVASGEGATATNLVAAVGVAVSLEASVDGNSSAFKRRSKAAMMLFNSAMCAAPCSCHFC